MKRFPLWVGMGVVISALCVPSALAQNEAAERAALIEDLRGVSESIRRLTDRLDILENNYAALQRQVAQIQAELRALSATPPASAGDLQRLETALKELNTARERDKLALVEQVAKMLEEFAQRLPRDGTRGSSGATAPAIPSEPLIKHTVKAGENLTVIAKTYGVSVAEIQKANQLTSDLVKVGQVLVIPKKTPPASP